jgi:hypothetical protein
MVDVAPQRVFGTPASRDRPVRLPGVNSYWGINLLHLLPHSVAPGRVLISAARLTNDTIENRAVATICLNLDVLHHIAIDNGVQAHY